MISIRPTKDKAYINYIYANDFIKNRIHQDGLSLRYIEDPSIRYLKASIDGEDCGFFLTRVGMPDFEAHVCLLPRATLQSRQLGHLFIAWCFSHGAHRLTAPVSSMNRSVVNYCKRLGFEIEGIKKEAINSNGVFYDEFIMGLTKDSYYGRNS